MVSNYYQALGVTQDFQDPPSRSPKGSGFLVNQLKNVNVISMYNCFTKNVPTMKYEDVIQ